MGTVKNVIISILIIKTNTMTIRFAVLQGYVILNMNKI